MILTTNEVRARRPGITILFLVTILASLTTLASSQNAVAYVNVTQNTMNEESFDITEVFKNASLEDGWMVFGNLNVTDVMVVGHDVTVVATILNNISSVDTGDRRWLANGACVTYITTKCENWLNSQWNTQSCNGRSATDSCSGWSKTSIHSIKLESATSGVLVGQCASSLGSTCRTLYTTIQHSSSENGNTKSCDFSRFTFTWMLTCG